MKIGLRVRLVMRRMMMMKIFLFWFAGTHASFHSRLQKRRFEQIISILIWNVTPKPK
jgi:hypothetical protein